MPQSIPSPSKSKGTTTVQPFEDETKHDTMPLKEWNAVLPALADWLGLRFPELVDPQGAYYDDLVSRLPSVICRLRPQYTCLVPPSPDAQPPAVQQQHWVELGSQVDARPLKVLITVATPSSTTPAGRRRSSTSKDATTSTNMAIPVVAPGEDIDAVVAHYTARVLQTRGSYIHSLQFDVPTKASSPTGRSSWVDVTIDVEDVKVDTADAATNQGGASTGPGSNDVRQQRTSHAIALLRKELEKRSSQAFNAPYKAPPSLSKLAHIFALSSFGKAKAKATPAWNSKFRSAARVAAALAKGRPHVPPLPGVGGEKEGGKAAGATPRRRAEDQIRTITSASEAQQQALLAPVAAVMAALRSVMDVTQ